MLLWLQPSLCFRCFLRTQQPPCCCHHILILCSPLSLRQFPRTKKDDRFHKEETEKSTDTLVKQRRGIVKRIKYGIFEKNKSKQNHAEKRLAKKISKKAKDQNLDTSGEDFYIVCIELSNKSGSNVQIVQSESMKTALLVYICHHQITHTDFFGSLQS